MKLFLDSIQQATVDNNPGCARWIKQVILSVSCSTKLTKVYINSSTLMLGMECILQHLAK